MATHKIKLEIVQAWWFTYLYMPILRYSIVFMWYFGCHVEPDRDKFKRIMKKATRFYLNGRRVYVR